MRIYASQRLVHIVVLRVALVVLKVGERCCLNTDVECPALMVAEGYPCERHLPAVQIARDRYRGHRHLARREVVARGRSNHRLGRELDAGIEVDGLLQVLFISRGAVICQLGTIVEAIVEAEVPRYREVVILARHPLSSHCGVELAIGVAPRVEVLGRERGDVVTRNLSSIFA